eukprot:6190429-Pleurochrysis_carterae.AAC.4
MLTRFGAQVLACLVYRNNSRRRLTPSPNYTTSQHDWLQLTPGQVPGITERLARVSYYHKHLCASGSIEQHT